MFVSLRETLHEKRLHSNFFPLNCNIKELLFLPYQNSGHRKTCSSFTRLTTLRPTHQWKIKVSFFLFVGGFFCCACCLVFFFGSQNHDHDQRSLSLQFFSASNVDSCVCPLWCGWCPGWVLVNFRIYLNYGGCTMAALLDAVSQFYWKLLPQQQACAVLAGEGGIFCVCGSCACAMFAGRYMSIVIERLIERWMRMWRQWAPGLLEQRRLCIVHFFAAGNLDLSTWTLWCARRSCLFVSGKD